MKKDRFFCGCFWVLVLILTSCEKGEELDRTPPVLSTAPIATEQILSIIPFGEDLTPNQKNPAFEYIVSNADVSVITSLSGTVDKILNNSEFEDKEIRIKPTSNSNWTIFYDHVKDLAISEGDFLEVGDVMGTVGEGNRVELQLNEGDGSETISHCPFNFASEEFINAHLIFSENWCLTDTVLP